MAEQSASLIFSFLGEILSKISKNSKMRPRQTTSAILGIFAYLNRPLSPTDLPIKMRHNRYELNIDRDKHVLPCF